MPTPVGKRLYVWTYIRFRGIFVQLLIPWMMMMMNISIYTIQNMIIKLLSQLFDSHRAVASDKILITALIPYQYCTLHSVPYIRRWLYMIWGYYKINLSLCFYINSEILGNKITPKIKYYYLITLNIKLEFARTKSKSKSKVEQELVKFLVLGSKMCATELGFLLLCIFDNNSSSWSPLESPFPIMLHYSLT